MSFRVCIACHGFRVYPYVGFMTGQRFQCQDCLELMVIPLEFENEEAAVTVTVEPMSLGEEEAPKKTGNRSKADRGNEHSRLKKLKHPVKK